MKRSGKPETAGLWTLPELCRLIENALAHDAAYQAPQNGQIRAVPNQRALRFYATLGILDRPTQIHGRTAYYNRRHLMQVVAIKRLQAQGLPLNEIQQRLYGLDDERLAALARLPDLPDAASPAPPEPARSEEAFWEAVPAAVHAVPAAGAPAVEAPVSLHALEAAVQGVRLDEHTLLVLEGTAEVSPEDRQAIRAAAAPLLRWLHERGW